MKSVYGYQICPFCGGNVEYAGISSGHIFPDINACQLYICRKCGYKGGFIIEVDDLSDVKNIKESQNMYRADVPAFRYPRKWLWLYRILLILIVARLIFGIIYRM